MKSRLAFLASVAASPFLGLAISHAAPPSAPSAAPAVSSAAPSAWPSAYPSAYPSAAPSAYPSGFPLPMPSASASAYPPPAPSGNPFLGLPPATRPFGHLRVLHVSAGLPAVDLCFARRGIPFDDYANVRPALGGRGLSFGQMSTYVELPEHVSGMRVVAAGSRDCMHPLAAGDSIGAFALPAGGYFTVVMDRAFAPGERGLVSSVYADAGPGAPKDGGVYLRAVHLVPGVEIGTGALATGDFAPLAMTSFHYARFEHAVSDVTLSAHREGSLADGIVAPLSIAAGHVGSVHVLEGARGDGLRAVTCRDDHARSATRINATCRLIPR